MNGSSAPNRSQLADFCRNKKNKIDCAVVACDSLDAYTAQRVSSIVEVLQNDIY